MRLGGWHRTWVLLCTIYLAAVVIIAYLFLPSETTHPHSDKIYDGMARESIAMLVTDPSKNDIVSVEIHNGHILRFPAGTSIEKMELVANDYARSLSQVVATERRRYLLVTLILWLGPCLTIYALGWGIHWVHRGFRG